MVDQLLAAGALPDSVALAMAAEAGEAGAVASLLKAGVAVDEAVGSSRTSPLIKAAAAGQAAAQQHLTTPHVSYSGHVIERNT